MLPAHQSMAYQTSSQGSVRAPAGGTSIHSKAFRHTAPAPAGTWPGYENTAGRARHTRLALQQGLAAAWVHSCRSHGSDRSAADAKQPRARVLNSPRAAPFSSLPARAGPAGLSGPRAHYLRTWYRPVNGGGSTCIGGVVLGINSCPPDPASSRRCLLRLLQRGLG